MEACNDYIYWLLNNQIKILKCKNLFAQKIQIKVFNRIKIVKRKNLLAQKIQIKVFNEYSKSKILKYLICGLCSQAYALCGLCSQVPVLLWPVLFKFALFGTAFSGPERFRTDFFKKKQGKGSREVESAFSRTMQVVHYNYKMVLRS